MATNSMGIRKFEELKAQPMVKLILSWLVWLLGIPIVWPPFVFFRSNLPKGHKVFMNAGAKKSQDEKVTITVTYILEIKVVMGTVHFSL